jgi:hypothetical protein
MAHLDALPDSVIVLALGDMGREELVVRSIISWIKTKKVDRIIGE